MRALVLKGHGDLSQLELAEVPDPVVRRGGDVRVRLKAAALNHLDLWTVRGLPGLALEFPHIVGADGAGEVDQVGDDVAGLNPGDRVMINPGVSCYRCEYCLAGEQSLCVKFQLLGEHLPGTLAEFIVLPQENVVPIPTPPSPQPDVSWEEAAAYSLVTLTAWRMLMKRARLQAGETVLVWGVGGGVSGAALRIAKLVGAFVIVTSSSDEKLAMATELGADVALNHVNTDVVKEVQRITERRGVDVVVENVGEATWQESLRVLGRGGRLVTCGATTGPNAAVDVRRLFWYQWNIMGSTMGSWRDYQDIVRLLGQGRLRPIVDSVFPLEKAVEAFERMEHGGQMGKLVIGIE
jgi:NADPH:quinone reductase-like Zn-dependent oxidoreductase